MFLGFVIAQRIRNVVLWYKMCADGITDSIVCLAYSTKW